MKKRLILKNKIVDLIIIANFIIVMLASAEIDDLRAFLLSKLFLIIVLCFNLWVLSKYSKVFDDDDK